MHVMQLLGQLCRQSTASNFAALRAPTAADACSMMTCFFPKGWGFLSSARVIARAEGAAAFRAVHAPALPHRFVCHWTIQWQVVGAWLPHLRG